MALDNFKHKKLETTPSEEESSSRDMKESEAMDEEILDCINIRFDQETGRPRTVVNQSKVCSYFINLKKSVSNKKVSSNPIMNMMNERKVRKQCLTIEEYYQKYIIHGELQKGLNEISSANDDVKKITEDTMKYIESVFSEIKKGI